MCQVAACKSTWKFPLVLRFHKHRIVFFLAIFYFVVPIEVKTPLLCCFRHYRPCRTGRWNLRVPPVPVVSKSGATEAVLHLDASRVAGAKAKRQITAFRLWYLWPRPGPITFAVTDEKSAKFAFKNHVELYTYRLSSSSQIKSSQVAFN